MKCKDTFATEDTEVTEKSFMTTLFIPAKTEFLSLHFLLFNSVLSEITVTNSKLFP